MVQTEATFRRTQEEVVVGLEVADDEALKRIRGGWAGAFLGNRTGRGTPAPRWS